ncbi:MAG: phosphohydrolase, partial [Bacteroides sp.]
NPTCLEQFIQLDDNDIWTSLKVWCSHEDRVLRTLSRGMVDRLIFKVEVSNEPFDTERIESIKKDVSQRIGISLKEADYLVMTSRIERNMYNPADDSIDILYNDGTIRGVAEASDMLNISLLSKKVKKYYLCYLR